MPRLYMYLVLPVMGIISTVVLMVTVYKVCLKKRKCEHKQNTLPEHGVTVIDFGPEDVNDVVKNEKAPLADVKAAVKDKHPSVEDKQTPVKDKQAPVKDEQTSVEDEQTLVDDDTHEEKQGGLGNEKAEANENAKAQQTKLSLNMSFLLNPQVYSAFSNDQEETKTAVLQNILQEIMAK